MNPTYPLSVVLLVLSAILVAPAAADQPEPVQLEDPLEPLDPKHPRSEAEEDRVTASAQFALARMLFQRKDFAGALRRYQRAWRYDPDSVPIWKLIVPLAAGLNRKDEAARYAIIGIESEPADPRQLFELAAYLTQQRQWEDALKLYEKALELQERTETNIRAVIISLEMGRLYFIQERFEDSAKSFRVVRDALENPDRYGLNESLRKMVLGQADRTYSLMAEAFLQAGHTEDAVAMFEKADEAKPNKALLSFQKARIDHKDKKYHDALQKLNAYFDAQSSAAGSEPYELFAEILQATADDKEKARQQLRDKLAQLYEDDPANTALGYYLAGQYLEVDEFANAERIYDEALRLQPSIGGYAGLIDACRQQGKVDKLLEVLGQAVFQTGTLEPLQEAVEPLAADGNLVEKLIETAQQRKGDAKFIETGIPLAMTLLAVEGGQFGAADEFFELALKASQPPKSQIMVTYGLELFMADEFKRAVDVFARAIDENVLPDTKYELQFYLAGALEMDGKTDDALKVAEQAALSQPDSPRIQSRFAWITYHAKRLEEAEERYKKLLEKFDSDYSSESTREVMRDARMVLSNICVQLDRLPEAEEWLEQVLDEFPQNIGAENDLGYLWVDQGKHLQRGFEMVKRAVEAEPGNAAYRDSLGWALYRLGRYGEAVVELEKAIEGEDEPDGIILDHLGDAYLKNDQRDKAVEAWQKAVDSFKENGGNEKYLKKTQKKLKKHKSANG